MMMRFDYLHVHKDKSAHFAALVVATIPRVGQLKPKPHEPPHVAALKAKKSAQMNQSVIATVPQGPIPFIGWVIV